MKTIRKQLSKAKFPRWLPSAGLNERGQSIIIITFAFLGLIAMLGIALDVGMVYIERVRLKRTVDAAALAAVTELPVEEEAAIRAMNYLNENGYDLSVSNVYLAGCTKDIRNKYLASTGASGTDGTKDLINLPSNTVMNAKITQANDTLPLDPTLYYPYVVYDTNSDGQYSQAVEGLAPAFYIDTRSYQDRSTPGTSELCDVGKLAGSTASSFGGASKIKVSGQLPVRMSFMQFFGFKEVTISDSATAENSSSLDAVVVLDNTGSMEFDTICYGCWARCLDTNTTSGTIDYGAYTNGGNNAFLIPSGECTTAADHYKQYPENGRAFPYDFNGTVMTNLRTGNSGLPRPEDRNSDGDFADTNEDFIMLEAEFYSLNYSSWDPATRSAGRGYWAMQRNWEAKAYSIDGYGYGGRSFYAQYLSGSVRHHPYYPDQDGNAFGRFYTLAEAQSNSAPMLEYNFMPTWSGNTYIYVRYLDGPDDTTARIFWTIANSSGTNLQTVAQKDGTSQNGGDWLPKGCSAWDCGSSEGNIRWRWELLNSSGNALTANQLYKLRIFAGQPGFEMDRILITSRNPTETQMNDASLGSTDSVRVMREAAATAGSAQGLAADPCNPIFGLSVLPTDCTQMILPRAVNNINDALFGAMQPIRGAQESIRSFIARLDPKLDQAGFIHFNSDAYQDSQLECLRAARVRKSLADAGSYTQLSTYPLSSTYYPNYDELNCADVDNAVSGTVPISYTNAFIAIENTYPSSGDTDIADGLRRGLHMLGINTDNNDSNKHANDCAWRRSTSTPYWWQLPRLTSGSYLNQPGSDSKANPVISHCARGQAATGLIVLLTDGVPTNANPGDNATCNATATDPIPYEGFPDSDSKFRCVMHYTNIAADNGVLVYTIGLGVGADRDLLNAIADQTNAKAYFVLTSSQLDVIFDQILANVYVRLVE